MTQNKPEKKTVHIAPTFEPFLSPIDGSMITCPKKLRDHNKRHGVTDIRDYGDDFFRRMSEQMYKEKTGDTPQAREERRQLCYKVLEQYKMIG